MTRHIDEEYDILEGSSIGLTDEEIEEFLQSYQGVGEINED